MTPRRNIVRSPLTKPMTRKRTWNCLSPTLEALEAGVKALDNAVTEATKQRNAENTEYKDLITSNTNAKEVLLWAKNSLNKFYDPKLYKPAPKRHLDEAEQIALRDSPEHWRRWSRDHQDGLHEGVLPQWDSYSAAQHQDLC